MYINLYGALQYYQTVDGVAEESIEIVGVIEMGYQVSTTTEPNGVLIFYGEHYE